MYKLQHINDPDNVGPVKSYLNLQVYKKLKGFLFIFYYFFLLFGLMKKYLRSYTKCLHFKKKGKVKHKTNPLCMKTNDKSAIMSGP